MEKGDEKFLMEVKGCTLFRDGIGYFPDAPTERGAKHLRELTAAVKSGFNTMVAFVIQGEGISEVRPNAETDPGFTKAFYAAKEAGVKEIRIHDLRHSHISLLISLGFSPVEIAKRVGHESITITLRYAHMFPSAQKEMMDKLNRLTSEEQEED